MSSTKPPSGTRDFLPADVRRREYVIGVIRSVYERYGFEPLETPAFENIETLLGKYGEEGNKLIFKILRRGEHEAAGTADLALRYDLTVPLARVIAQYQNDLPRFFKRYQIQPVWRADRPAKGRFREFYQCDIDALGSSSPMVEVEILTAVCEALERLGFTDFVLRVNHRKLLPRILGTIPAPLHAEAITALDKLDKLGESGVRDEMVQRGISADAAGAALDGLRKAMAPATASPVSASAVLDGVLAAFPMPGTETDPVEAAVAPVLRLLEETPAGRRIRFDPSLARGLSYYTGAIMEIAVPDLAGSLGGGGRYDNLVGMFLGRDVPACGFSLGLERILVVMAERKMFPPEVESGPADVMVALWNAESRGEALALAGELRAAGLRVDVYPESDKLGKQFKYAATRRAPFVVVMGDEERARGEVTVKDLRSGAQERVARPAAGAHIGQRLQTPETGAQRPAPST